MQDQSQPAGKTAHATTATAGSVALHPGAVRAESQADAPRTLALDRPVGPPRAWHAAAIQRDDWLVALPDACIEELLAAAAHARANPLPTLVQGPDDFQLTACRTFMTSIRERLDHGLGLVVLDRLPMGQLARDEAVLCYWLLASLLARPVAQTFAGTLIYDVRDQGLRYAEKVRASVTTDELGFHSDNAYGRVPPDILGLLCLQHAKAGGISRLVSLLALHNVLRERHPALLERAYRPFLFSQGTEHAAGEAGLTEAPVFGFDAGGFRARLHRVRIERGYAKAGLAMDDAAVALMDAIDAFLAEPGHWFDMQFQPGQMQFIDNRVTGHMRTAFEDWPEPERKRHLVRLWLREGGRRSYNG